MKEVKTIKSFQKLPKSERIKVYLPEKEMNKVEIRDNKEKIVNLKKVFEKENIPVVFASVFGKKLSPRLRETAALNLIKAAKSILPDYLFKITDTLRPISFQKKQFESIKQKIINEKPKLSNDPEKLYNEVTKYSADPEGCPPHSTGGAIDLTIVRKDKKGLNMGTSVDTISELSGTFNDKITEKEKNNRLILFNAMTKKGFVNLPTEWWHYSYGDQYWAAFHKKPHTLYGKIEKIL